MKQFWQHFGYAMMIVLFGLAGIIGGRRDFSETGIQGSLLALAFLTACAAVYAAARVVLSRHQRGNQPEQ